MRDKEKTGNLFARLKHHSLFLVLLWTGCIAASLLWNLYEQREKILKIARNSAQITFENDILYRRWAAKQGGVYVPASEHTPPNPYLHVPDRDITTSSGLSLTLVNPAYMARQVNQMAAEIRGSQGHITSLNPICPENIPDSWEAAALKSFEGGVKEVSSVEKIAGEEYMRLMRPFIAGKACLKCHASQGYKEGDVLQHMGKAPNVMAQSLGTIIPVIQEGVEECRRIQMDLRPSMLDDLGLLATLSWFCRRFQTIYSGIRVEQEVAIEESEIPGPLKIVIYRVTQEAMNNVAKHSKAEVVRLSVRKLAGRMELVLQDNGQGFNLEKTRSQEAPNRGLGLLSMKERTELSGGSLAIESAEGKGTRVRASWPFHENG